MLLEREVEVIVPAPVATLIELRLFEPRWVQWSAIAAHAPEEFEAEPVNESATFKVTWLASGAYELMSTDPKPWGEDFVNRLKLNRTLDGFRAIATMLPKQERRGDPNALLAQVDSTNDLRAEAEAFFQ